MSSSPSGEGSAGHQSVLWASRRSTHTSDPHLPARSASRGLQGDVKILAHVHRPAGPGQGRSTLVEQMTRIMMDSDVHESEPCGEAGGNCARVGARARTCCRGRCCHRERHPSGSGRGPCPPASTHRSCNATRPLRQPFARFGPPSSPVLSGGEDGLDLSSSAVATGQSSTQSCAAASGRLVQLQRPCVLAAVRASAARWARCERAKMPQLVTPHRALGVTDVRLR
jgi:hypothetical protein